MIGGMVTQPGQLVTEVAKGAPGSGAVTLAVPAVCMHIEHASDPVAAWLDW